MIYRLLQFIERQHAVIRIPAIWLLCAVLGPVIFPLALVRYIFA